MKLLRGLIVSMVIIFSGASAELVKVFGLKDQEFAELSDKKLNKYKLNENVIVSLQLLKTDAFDGYRHFEKNGGSDKGYIGIEFITPTMTNWVLTEDIDLRRFYGKNTVIKFMDENGLALILEIKDGGGKSAKICTLEKCSERIEGRTQLRVTRVNNTTTYKINEKALATDNATFGKLKRFEQGIYAVQGTNDVLTDLIFSEIK